MGSHLATMHATFLAALVTVTLASDIVVNVQERELSPAERSFCCGSVRQRCARARVGRSCSLRCTGYCGIFHSKCGPWQCSYVTNACASATTTTTAGTTAAGTTATGTTAGGTTAAGTTAAGTTAAGTTACGTTAGGTTAAAGTTAAGTTAAGTTAGGTTA